MSELNLSNDVLKNLLGLVTQGVAKDKLGGAADLVGSLLGGKSGGLGGLAGLAGGLLGGAKGGANDILAQLGINPYFAGEYDTAIRNYPVKKTMRAIALLREYDRRSKSNTRGEASDGDLLKELIAKILA